MALKILPQAFKYLFCRTFFTFRIHPYTVDEVSDHMKSQPYHDETKDLMFYKNRSQKVKGNNIFRMQIMKPDAAPAGMKNWNRQQMIQVHQHGGKQNEPEFFPVRFIIPVGYGTYEDEVEEVMHYRL